MGVEMEAQSLSTCNQCGKKFQRKAHLLRHQQQHSGDRPYSCKFCAKTFKRSDVLRDHFSRCERRGTSAIPSSLERGRKRHACDECSRLKVKCDNNVPCRKCTEFGRKCVKTRSSTNASTTSSPENNIRKRLLLARLPKRPMIAIRSDFFSIVRVRMISSGNSPSLPQEAQAVSQRYCPHRHLQKSTARQVLPRAQHRSFNSTGT